MKTLLILAALVSAQAFAQDAPKEDPLDTMCRISMDTTETIQHRIDAGEDCKSSKALRRCLALPIASSGPCLSNMRSREDYRRNWMLELQLLIAAGK